MKLIQSLERGFDILELLSGEPERAFPLGEIAQAVGLHPATCSHLLGTLVDRGYVESAGARKGYRFGSMGHYLVRNKPFGGNLALRAEPLLEAVSARLGEWVVLTAMAGIRRLVLLELNSSPQAVQLDRRALRLAEGAYDSASVWLFMAFDEPSVFARFQALNGLPADCADPQARLAQVREDGFCIYEDRAAGVAKVAFPIWQNDKVAAAVGVHLPAFRFVGDHRQAVMASLAELAVQLGTGTGRSRA